MDSLFDVSGCELYFITKFIGYDRKCFGIKTLVHCNHNTEWHTSANHFVDRHIHHCSQFVYGNELGYFEYFFLLFLFCEFLFCFLAVSFAFFFAIFSSFRFGTFSLQAFEGFAYLFLYLFFSRFYFSNNLVFLFFFRSVAAFSHIHFIFADAFAFAFFAIVNSASSTNSGCLCLFIFVLVLMAIAFAFFLLFLKLTEVNFFTYHFRACKFLVLSFNHANRSLRGSFFFVFGVLFLFLRRGRGLHQRVLINRFIFLSVGFWGFFLFDIFLVFVVMIFIFVVFSRLSRRSYSCFRCYYGLHRSRRGVHYFGFRSFGRKSFFLFFTPIEVNFAHRFESCQLSFGTNHFLFLLLAFFFIFLLLFHTDGFTLFALIFYNFFRNRTLIFVGFKFVRKELKSLFGNFSVQTLLNFNVFVFFEFFHCGCQRDI